jgi:hypothetical protein
VCLSLPSAALGKQSLCRVPDILHSANSLALGKGLVSGSEWYNTCTVTTPRTNPSGILRDIEVINWLGGKSRNVLLSNGTVIVLYLFIMNRTDVGQEVL